MATSDSYTLRPQRSPASNHLHLSPLHLEANRLVREHAPSPRSSSLLPHPYIPTPVPSPQLLDVDVRQQPPVRSLKRGGSGWPKLPGAAGPSSRGPRGTRGTRPRMFSFEARLNNPPRCKFASPVFHLALLHLQPDAFLCRDENLPRAQWILFFVVERWDVRPKSNCLSET